MANPNNQLLQYQLDVCKKDNNILTKQLQQSKREYSETLFRQKELEFELTESRTESAELRSKLNRVTENQETVTKELRLEVKMLRHRCKEADDEVEKMRKKAKNAAALEGEISGLKRIADAAKLAEEKAVKEKEEVVMKNEKLERDMDSIVECAMKKFKGFDKRVLKLEACAANLNNNSDSSPGQGAAPVGVQETMDSVIVDLDSD